MTTSSLKISMSLFCVTHNLPSQTLKLVCSYFLWVKNPTTIDYQLIVFLSLSLSLFVHEYTHTIIVIVSDETLCRSIQSQIIRNRPSSITLRWTSNPCLIDYNQSPVDITINNRQHLGLNRIKCWSPSHRLQSVSRGHYN